MYCSTLNEPGTKFQKAFANKTVYRSLKNEKATRIVLLEINKI